MMKRSIEKLRCEYGNTPLLEADLPDDPISLFLKWLKDAIHARVLEPNAMTLATVSSSGHPTSRVVLLKGLERGEFVFYTNYASRKGEHLTIHPEASLTFWWRDIYRQVNVEGRVKKISRKRSLAYFRKRPRGAQLAALASAQSTPLAGRAEIDEAFLRLKKRHRGRDVPCPKEWGGYCLVPERVEFWQGRQDRLHDRFVYILTNGTWLFSRLSP